MTVSCIGIPFTRVALSQASWTPEGRRLEEELVLLGGKGGGGRGERTV